MGRRSWLGGVAVVGAAGALLLAQTSALATNVYPSTTVGYDISYPQCGTTYPGGTFGIVGVNKGYPFTYYNACYPSEWTYAQATAAGYASLYINTGYDPSYLTVDTNHSTQDCVSKESGLSGTYPGITSGQEGAWAVGCSEAERSVAYASCGTNDPTNCTSRVTPRAWWLDIETANSWCGQSGTNCTDLTLNEYTIQGILDTLHTSGENPNLAPAGIYSTSSQWSAIVGGNPVRGINADWVATGTHSEKRAKSYCTTTGFAGSAPVWLAQYVPGSYDADYAC